MPTTTNTIVGKQQNTFRLVSEETSVRWRQKVGPVTVTANTYDAGEVVTVDLSSGILRRPNANVDKGNIYGVAFETHKPELDECAAAGLGTWIINPHVGQISDVIHSIAASATAGAKLYFDRSASSKRWTSTSGANTGVMLAYLLRRMGNWIEYYWVGVDNA